MRGAPHNPIALCRPPHNPIAPLITPSSLGSLLPAAAAEEEEDDKGGIESSPLGRSLFALLLAVASGERTAGEREGACHLQLWRS